MEGTILLGIPVGNKNIWDVEVIHQTYLIGGNMIFYKITGHKKLHYQEMMRASSILFWNRRFMHNLTILTCIEFC